MVDFRKKGPPVPQLFINGDPIEKVGSFKFLGSLISEDLKWDNNVSSIVKKANQRMYFLRQLRKFGMKKVILIHFYRAVIESILTFSIIVWFGNTSAKQITKLNRIVKTASKIVGCELPSLESLYETRTKKRAHRIIEDATHPANDLFEMLPSGKIY